MKRNTKPQENQIYLSSEASESSVSPSVWTSSSCSPSTCSSAASSSSSPVGISSTSPASALLPQASAKSVSSTKVCTPFTNVSKAHRPSSSSPQLLIPFNGTGASLRTILTWRVDCFLGQERTWTCKFVANGQNLPY